MKKLWLLLAGLLVLPNLSYAQETKTGTLFYKFDLDSTSFTYCKVTGLNGAAIDAKPIPNDFKIKTTGSSTSVTENTASTNPFTLLSAGDILVVQRIDGTTDVREIVTRTDAANVVIDSAVDWSGGFFFGWFKQSCGITATDGWIDVQGAESVGITFMLEQVNVTGGIDVRWECKDSSFANNPVIVYPGETDGCGGGTLSSGNCNFTTAGITSRTKVVLYESWSACRLGVKIGSADDGDDTGANLERINGTVSIRQWN